MDENLENVDAKDATVRALIEILDNYMRNFLEQEGIDMNLSGKERRRLTGSGVRNYGFIDKAYDIARDNPEFMPPHLDVSALINSMHDL